MKKLILFLLLTISIYPQSNLLMLMGDDGVSYDADAQTYFDAMTTPLSSAYQDRINTFVLMVKDSLSLTNLSDKFDVMYLLANETAEASLRNLTERDHDADTVATITFVADEGWTSNGSDGYIDTDYNPAVDSVNFTTGTLMGDQEASIGIYSRTNAQSATWMFGAGATPYLIMRGRSASDQMNTYYFGNSERAISNDNSSGLLALSTFATENLYGFYRNGVRVGADLTIEASAPDRNLFICCYNNNGTPTGFTAYQFSFFFIGGELTATQMRGLNNCIEWYMDDLGKGVQ